MDTSLTAALDELAARPTLLIAVDFDGTLAPLGDDPMQVSPVPGAMAVLAELADLARTTVAVVSGRDLATLRNLTGASDPIVLVGSHGAESSRDDTGPLLTEAEQQRLTALSQDLGDLLDDHPQARLEHKPSARVLHTRGLSDHAAAEAASAGAAIADRHDEVTVTEGKDVLEMAVTRAGKGPALVELAQSIEADAILYAGDDVTDERAFAHLGRHDLSIKVGDGQTAAEHRVANEHAMVEVLQHLLSLRT